MNFEPESPKHATTSARPARLAEQVRDSIWKVVLGGLVVLAILVVSGKVSLHPSDGPCEIANVADRHTEFSPSAGTIYYVVDNGTPPKNVYATDFANGQYHALCSRDWKTLHP